jgi:hypothetical protein
LTGKEHVLPDRYIKGNARNAAQKTNHEEQLRELRRGVCADRSDQPYSALSGATPVLKSSDIFLQAIGPALR